MARYAKSTSVPVSRSQDEIKRTLERYGVSSFGMAHHEGTHIIQFILEGNTVRMTVTKPDRLDGWESDAAYDRRWRQAWRILLLQIKAKLEAIDAGLSNVQREFMPDLVLPDGRTVADLIQPELEAAFENGAVPVFLPGLGQVKALPAPEPKP